MAELVVFYSLTGKSRRVAEWLATGLNAEIEEIVERRPRDLALRGAWRSSLNSLLRRRPPIKPMNHREAIFDRVILVCPIWGGRVAAPARTWLAEYGRGAKTLGLALQSSDGVSHSGVLSEFKAMIGRSAKPLLTVSEEDFGSNTAEQKVADFVRSITIEAAKFPVN